jgi:hypothetical protein
MIIDRSYFALSKKSLSQHLVLNFWKVKCELRDVIHSLLLSLLTRQINSQNNCFSYLHKSTIHLGMKNVKFPTVLHPH